MSKAVPMDRYELALLEQYPDLKVSTNSRGHFVVTDTQMPRGKQRREGGNLYSLLLRAIDERNRIKLKTLGPTEPVSKREDILESNIITFRPKQAKAKPKLITVSDMAELKEGKAFTIKMLIYNNPDISIKEIADHLKQKGMPSPISTIAAVRTDFLSSLRVLRDFGALK